MAYFSHNIKKKLPDLAGGKVDALVRLPRRSRAGAGHGGDLQLPHDRTVGTVLLVKLGRIAGAQVPEKQAQIKRAKHEKKKKWAIHRAHRVLIERHGIKKSRWHSFSFCIEHCILRYSYLPPANALHKPYCRYMHSRFFACTRRSIVAKAKKNKIKESISTCARTSAVPHIIPARVLRYSRVYTL